jgi:hypothetical protein
MDAQVNEHSGSLKRYRLTLYGEEGGVGPVTSSATVPVPTSSTSAVTGISPGTELGGGNRVGNYTESSPVMFIIVTMIGVTIAIASAIYRYRMRGRSVAASKVNDLDEVVRLVEEGDFDVLALEDLRNPPPESSELLFKRPSNAE